METKSSIKLAIIVPCYNEGDVLGITIPSLSKFLEKLIFEYNCSANSFIVLVDDGSHDHTWMMIENASKILSNRVRGIRLACNVGHQGALLTGLDYVAERCDAVVSIDADLQHDLSAIINMVEKYRSGYQIVLGVRETREGDSWFKRTTALGFYRLMKLMGVNLIENHADFRLMSSKVLKNLKQFREVNLFLRGLPPMLHQKIATVTFKVGERVAGTSKYTLGKMLGLAWNGITSFSIVPLRFILVIGGSIFLLSLIMIVYTILASIQGHTVPGWASIIVPLYFLGGLLRLSIGILGEYLGKLFLEVKSRPRFLIDNIVGEDN